MCMSLLASVTSLIRVDASSVTGRNWSALICSASCSASPRWSVIITTSSSQVSVLYVVGRYALMRVSARYMWVPFLYVTSRSYFLGLLSQSRGTCQNPFLANTTMEILALANNQWKRVMVPSERLIERFRINA